MRRAKGMGHAGPGASSPHRSLAPHLMRALGQVTDHLYRVNDRASCWGMLWRLSESERVEC